MLSENVRGVLATTNYIRQILDSLDDDIMVAGKKGGNPYMKACAVKDQAEQLVERTLKLKAEREASKQAGNS